MNRELRARLVSFISKWMTVGIRPEDYPELRVKKFRSFLTIVLRDTLLPEVTIGPKTLISLGATQGEVLTELLEMGAKQNTTPTPRKTRYYSLYD